MNVLVYILSTALQWTINKFLSLPFCKSYLEICDVELMGVLTVQSPVTSVGPIPHWRRSASSGISDDQLLG